MSIVNRPLQKLQRKQRVATGQEEVPATRMSQLVKAATMLKQDCGPLTSELVQTPQLFGLGQWPSTLAPQTVTNMVCGFCSTGCSLRVHMQEGKATGLSPNLSYPVNHGMACPKGWEALQVLQADDRAVSPLAGPRGALRKIGWNEAAELFCSKFKEIQKRHGQHSVAFFGTGQMPTEELAFLGSFAKFGMGLIHGDANTRQCMATAVTAYKQSFGFDAPPFTYADFEESDVLVFVGANPCIAHPIMWQRVLQNKRNPKTVVIDPRYTETAAAASMHLKLAPKSDLILFYAIAGEIIRRGKVDHAFVSQHTNHFEEFAAHVSTFTLSVAAQASGLPIASIEQLVDWIVGGARVSFWWTMGVNQSYEGVRVAQSLINLALMTGNIGKPGTGANSITGQCNAMGSRLFSNTSSLLGGRDFSNPAHREEVAKTLQIPVERIPDRLGWAYDQILDGIERGEIKGLWVIGANPAHSWIEHKRLKELFGQLEFLVVQDMYTSTETAALADLVLPAAGWGEKEGTLINSERRIGVIKKVSPAPRQALADFSIFRLLAHHWGCGDWFAKWTSPENTFQTLKELSRNRPCDITGIDSYKMLDDAGGVQWPYPAEHCDQAQERCLFADGCFYHADGRARFLFSDVSEPRERPDVDFPFLLLTGRGTSAQWHTQTRTSKSAVLRKLYPQQCYVEMHQEGAAKLGVVSGDWVQVASRRGALFATAWVANTVAQGQVFLPMHYPEVNRLTLSHFDPHSRQPSYKNCAVSIEKARPPVGSFHGASK